MSKKLSLSRKPSSSAKRASMKRSSSPTRPSNLSRKSSASRRKSGQNSSSTKLLIASSKAALIGQEVADNEGLEVEKKVPDVIEIEDLSEKSIESEDSAVEEDNQLLMRGAENLDNADPAAVAAALLGRGDVPGRDSFVGLSREEVVQISERRRWQRARLGFYVFLWSLIFGGSMITIGLMLFAESCPIKLELGWYEKMVAYRIHLKSFRHVSQDDDDEQSGDGNIQGLINVMEHYFCPLRINTLIIEDFFDASKLFEDNFNAYVSKLAGRIRRLVSQSRRCRLVATQYIRILIALDWIEILGVLGRHHALPHPFLHRVRFKAGLYRGKGGQRLPLSPWLCFDAAHKETTPLTKPILVRQVDQSGCQQLSIFPENEDIWKVVLERVKFMIHNIGSIGDGVVLLNANLLHIPFLALTNSTKHVDLDNAIYQVDQTLLDFRASLFANEDNFENYKMKMANNKHAREHTDQSTRQIIVAAGASHMADIWLAGSDTDAPKTGRFDMILYNLPRWDRDSKWTTNLASVVERIIHWKVVMSQLTSERSFMRNVHLTSLNCWKGLQQRRPIGGKEKHVRPHAQTESQLEIVLTLLLTISTTATLCYGEEVGIIAPARYNTIMAWNPKSHKGFSDTTKKENGSSTCTYDHRIAKQIPEYGGTTTTRMKNVLFQSAEGNFRSHYGLVKNLMTLRQESVLSLTLGVTKRLAVPDNNDVVLIYRSTVGHRPALVAINGGKTGYTVDFPLIVQYQKTSQVMSRRVFQFNLKTNRSKTPDNSTENLADNTFYQQASGISISHLTSKQQNYLCNVTARIELIASQHLHHLVGKTITPLSKIFLRPGDIWILSFDPDKNKRRAP